MIEDARYLRAGFVPGEVVHRDPEVNHLSNALRPLVNGKPTDMVFITGPTGLGKTCITKFTVDRLRQDNLDIESIYINCWNEHTGSECSTTSPRKSTTRLTPPPVHDPRRPLGSPP